MIFISGPSTIGKNPLIEELCRKYNYNFLIPWTTRNKRKEENGINDYHFISKSDFKNKINNGDIFEWDYALSNYYGYSNFDINSEKIITHGLSRMVIRIKKKYPNAVTTIFLMPENKNNIFNVLEKIYTGKDLVLRLNLVEEEIMHSQLFDYIFIIKDKSKELLSNSDFLRILDKK